MADEQTPAGTASDPVHISQDAPSPGIETKVKSDLTPAEQAESDQHAAENAAREGAVAAGMPPQAQVDALSEGREPDADGKYTSQEHLADVIKPAIPELKPVAEGEEPKPLPTFHPTIALPQDEYPDAERPAISADEIDKPEAK